jgi:hypothetical protein
MSCIKNCSLCKNLVISTSVTLVGTNVVIDIPTGCYCDDKKICLVIAQTIPTTAPISSPVVISIGGDTTTLYPVVKCDCTPVTVCALRTRKKYPLRVNTTSTSAVFKSLGGLSCQPNNNLLSIPVTTGGGA